MTRTLVLGGTAWLGREIVAQLLERGDEVVCLARGQSGAVPEGARLIVADRSEPEAYAAIARTNWDEVIELSYEPNLVAGALQALAERARHWTLISSVSVYASNSDLGADETAPLVEGDDLSDYAQAKLAAEVASLEALGDRLLIARPGLIAGPGDPSDRFGYWAARFALTQGEAVLTPQLTGRSVQLIDVRDLAAWVAGAARGGITGAFNVVGNSHAMTDALAAVAEMAGHSGQRLAMEDDWLLAHDVRYWAGARSLPLWLPAADTGFAQRSNERYLAAGGGVRSLTETIRDVLADERSRGLDRARRSGLTRSEELALLAEAS